MPLISNRSGKCLQAAQPADFTLNLSVMNTYDIALSDNAKATVLHKRVGVRKPVKFLFFKIRNKERLIAYTTLLENGKTRETLELFKSWKNGEWIQGLLKNGEQSAGENELIHRLKREIDHYESRLGKDAYTQLF